MLVFCIGTSVNRQNCRSHVSVWFLVIATEHSLNKKATIISELQPTQNQLLFANND